MAIQNGSTDELYSSHESITSAQNESKQNGTKLATRSGTSLSEMAKSSDQKIWSNLQFMRLFTAYAFAVFGDWFDTFAIQIMVVYRWNADPLIVALIPICMAVPGILFGTVAGALADRFHKVNIMLLCDILTVILTLSILFVPGPLWLLPLLALRAMISVFHTPAQQALTRQVVSENHLFQATSLNGFVNQCAKIAGPLLGAAVLVLFVPQVCIAINACMRLLSAILLWPLRYIQEQNENVSTSMPSAKQTRASDTWFTAWQQGWGFLRRNRIVRNTLLFSCLGLMSILMIEYQFTTLFREIKPHSETLLGWLGAAVGIGAVVAILILNRLPRIGYGWGLGGGYLFIGIGIAALGCMSAQTLNLWVIVWGLCTGIGNGLFTVTMNYLLQKETPAHYVGRVFGIQNSLFSMIMIVAPLAGGVLIQATDAGLAFQYIGLITIVIGFAGIVFQRICWRANSSAQMEENEATLS